MSPFKILGVVVPVELVLQGTEAGPIDHSSLQIKLPRVKQKYYPVMSR